MLILLFAFLAGVLSTLSPCVLPIVPIVMSSALQRHRFGPLALLMGITLSYSLVGTGLALFGSRLGIGAGMARTAGAALMLAFGMSMLVPALQRALAGLIAPFAAMANSRLSGLRTDGVVGQGMLGLLLGLVWAPCTGPTLGAAISMASHGNNVLHGLAVMVVFGMGVSTPMGLLALGSRATIGAVRQGMIELGRTGTRTMGVGLVLVAATVLSGLDRPIESVLTANMPGWLIDLTTRF